MTKKVNPRKVQATGEDVKRAFSKGIDIGVNRAVRMMLFLLVDKHEAPAEDVRQLSDELAWLATLINEGRISWSYVDSILEENHVEVRLR